MEMNTFRKQIMDAYCEGREDQHNNGGTTWRQDAEKYFNDNYKADIAAMDWISVNDKRPEIAKQVIVFLILDNNKKAGKSYAGFRANGGWYIQTIPNKSYVPNNDKRYTVTHWMSLPEHQPRAGAILEKDKS